MLSTHSSSEIAADDGKCTRAAPALLTRMSRPPNLAIASLATFCAPSNVRVSPAMKVAPFGVSACVLRAVTTTVAPPSSRRCAAAAPMPRDPPVIRARLPANSLDRSSLYLDIVVRSLKLGLGGAGAPGGQLRAGQLIQNGQEITRLRAMRVIGIDLGVGHDAVACDHVAGGHQERPSGFAVDQLEIFAQLFV